jgi:hypothetical protein
MLQSIWTERAEFDTLRQTVICFEGPKEGAFEERRGDAEEGGK